MENGIQALDEQRRARFVADGYLVVRTGLPDAFHQDLYGRLEEVFEKEGNPGNNILPRVPELQRVFADAAVAGALQSLLGPGYVMNPHRHCHLNPPGSKGQSWHKDCYVFDHNIRHPRFRWVLGFYYPQDVTTDMGPTGVLPRQQWYRTISDPDPQRATEEEQPLIGEAGTVSIVHFDSWHRATANTSDRKRYMLKFQFARTAEPAANGHGEGTGGPGWEESGAVCSDVWSWLEGGSGTPATGEPIGPWVDRLASASPAERARAADRIAVSGAAADAAPALTRALGDEAEAVRLHAAYGLAAAAEAAALVDDLRREALASEELATAKTADNAHGTNPTAPVAAHALAVAPDGAAAAAALLGDGHWFVRASAAGALANIGAGAAGHAAELLAATADEHWWVRRNALEALGRLPVLSPAAVEAATRGLADEDYRVRRNAAIALRHVATPAPETVTAMARLLDDDNRYNRFYAADGLRRLAPASAQAQSLLMDHLMASRWCPLTSPESTY